MVSRLVPRFTPRLERLGTIARSKRRSQNLKSLIQIPSISGQIRPREPGSQQLHQKVASQGVTKDTIEETQVRISNCRATISRWKRNPLGGQIDRISPSPQTPGTLSCQAQYQLFSLFCEAGWKRASQDQARYAAASHCTSDFIQ